MQLDLTHDDAHASLKPYVASSKRLAVDYGDSAFNEGSFQSESQGSPFALSLESAASRVEYNRHIGLLMQQEIKFWDEVLKTPNFDDSLSDSDSDREDLFLSRVENRTGLIQPVALNV
jgi:hypothetical protein